MHIFNFCVAFITKFLPASVKTIIKKCNGLLFDKKANINILSDIALKISKIFKNFAKNVCELGI